MKYHERMRDLRQDNDYTQEYVAKYLKKKLDSYGIKVDIATEKSPFTII